MNLTLAPPQGEGGAMGIYDGQQLVLKQVRVYSSRVPFVKPSTTHAADVIRDHAFLLLPAITFD